MPSIQRINKLEAVYLLLIGGLLLFIFHANLQWLWRSWLNNPNYSHGPLIPLIAAYIVYEKRSLLCALPRRPSTYGIVLLTAGLALHVISIRAQINFISSYAFITTLAGFILFWSGQRRFKEMIFPILLLFFMVPFWVSAISKANNLLKRISSIISFEILNIMDFPILRDGVMLHFPNGTLEVADPCSGIRSLLSLLALGTVIAYYSDGSIYKKLLIVSSAIPLALISNSIRVIFFGVLLQTQNIVIGDGFWHMFTGGVTFVLAFIGLLCISRWAKF